MRLGFIPHERYSPLTAVTPLLADDNWGNLMAVMPDNQHPGGGGIYYHVDCESEAPPTSRGFSCGERPLD